MNCAYDGQSYSYIAIQSGLGFTHVVGTSPSDLPFGAAGVYSLEEGQFCSKMLDYILA
jgi:hypothetical protein